MVYLDVDDLGYGPYVDSWLAKAYSAEEDRALIRDLFEKWVVRLLDFKRREVRFASSRVVPSRVLLLHLTAVLESCSELIDTHCSCLCLAPCLCMPSLLSLQSLTACFLAYVTCLLWCACNCNGRVQVKELVPTTDFNCVISLCRMFQALAVPANGCSRATDPEGYNAAMEKWFAFCCGQF
jgi:hypothetical protein